MIPFNHSEANFIDLKENLNELHIQSLLKTAIKHSTQQELEKTCYVYMSEPKYQIIGMKEENQVIGLIIFHLTNNHEAFIENIAIYPIHQNKEVLAALIHHIQDNYKLTKIVTTADRKKLRDYEKLGFRAKEVSNALGIYYKCIWEK